MKRTVQHHQHKGDGLEKGEDERSETINGCIYAICLIRFLQEIHADDDVALYTLLQTHRQRCNWDFSSSASIPSVNRLWWVQRYELVNAFMVTIFIARVSTGGNAIASVRLSVCFHSNCSTEWPLTFCTCMGHSSHEIESQGHRSRLGLGWGSQFETRSVWPRSSFKDSLLV